MVKYSYDASGNTMSRMAVIIIPPEIKAQPSTQVIEPGEIATFSVVVADASGVTFKWKFNGTDILGATSDSLLLTNVSAANQGQYSVVVTNSAGSVASDPALLLLDIVHDELPDSWEIANFGNTTSQRSEGDPDKDGISNLDEFLDGTNPNSNASLRPRLTTYSDLGGSVTVNPMKLSYDLGETVTLTATPVAPNVFIGWEKDLTGTTNPATITMTANKTIRTKFASAAPLPPGLVAFYRGETDAGDLIGGHHGAFFRGATPVVPSLNAVGKVGGALSFDGTVHVRISDSAELRLAQITIECWVFPTLLSSVHQTIVAFGSSANEDDTWALALFNGKARFFSHGTVLLERPSAIPLNQWTHLAISFDGNIKRLYVNGAQAAAQGGLGALVYDNNPIPVTIGSDWAGNVSNSRFTGLVDELSIYNWALTLNEVADIYNADFVGKNTDAPYFTTPSPLPDVALGANYSQQLTTVLGTPPISFSLSAGGIPPGTLSSTGLLSGTGSLTGVFDFTVRATDSAGLSSEQLFVLRVLQPITPPADLVAWWRSEPVSGSVVADIIGGHQGGFFTGNTASPPSYTTDGKVGGAFIFDGTVHVQVPGAVELRLSELTLEAWVFPMVQNANYQGVIAYGSSINDDDTWALALFNGKVRFFSHGTVLLEGPSAIPLHQWTHLAASFDGTTKRLYVNGIEVAAQGGLGTLVYDVAALVTIGSDWTNNAPTYLFNGRIDEVSLYRRALSAGEIFSITDAGPAGKSTSGPYITSPSRLPAAITGQAYAQTFTSVLGIIPINFTLSSSSTLPTGLTLTIAGILSGIPTNSGAFTFVVRATDNAGQINEQQCTMRIFEIVPTPAGLVGWWKAEGNTRDSAGTNHGTLQNGAVFALGEVNQAFSLNGTGACIEIPDAPALRPVSLTLEAWILFDATSGTRVVFAKPVGAGASDSYALWLQDGVINGVVGDSAGIGTILRPTFSLAQGLWYHLAYSFDDSSRHQALYVNGVQVAAGITTKSIKYDTQSLFLGRDTENGTPNFFLQGRIDEASIYNRALNATEIMLIYNAGSAGKR